AVGKQRAQRPVDLPAGDALLLRRAPFALEEAARDAPRRVRVLLVVDGQGEEVARDAALHVGAGRGEHHGVAEAHGAGAVRLLGEVAGLDHELTGADGYFSSQGHIRPSTLSGAPPPEKGPRPAGGERRGNRNLLRRVGSMGTGSITSDRYRSGPADGARRPRTGRR